MRVFSLLKTIAIQKVDYLLTSLLGLCSKSLLLNEIPSSMVTSGDGDMVEGVERLECLPLSSED